MSVPDTYSHGGVLERALDDDYQADPDATDDVEERVNAGSGFSGGGGQLSQTDDDDEPSYDPSEGIAVTDEEAEGDYGGVAEWEPPEGLADVQVTGDSYGDFDVSGDFGSYEPEPEETDETPHGGVLDRATDDEYQADPDATDDVEERVNAGSGTETSSDETETETENTSNDTTDETETEDSEMSDPVTAGDLFRGTDSGASIPGASSELSDITLDELEALDATGTDLFIPGYGDATADADEDGAAVRDRETGEVTGGLDPESLRETTQELADQYEAMQEDAQEGDVPAAVAQYEAMLAEQAARIAEMAGVEPAGDGGGLSSAQLAGGAVAALVIAAAVARYAGVV